MNRNFHGETDMVSLTLFNSLKYMECPTMEKIQPEAKPRADGSCVLGSMPVCLRGSSRRLIIVLRHPHLIQITPSHRILQTLNPDHDPPTDGTLQRLTRDLFNSVLGRA